MNSTVQNLQDQKTLNLAMSLSLYTGFFMLVTKMTAYFITDSAAILSDAAESVVHVVAVGFAAWSLHLVQRKADRSHQFGYDRISFFSAGFEGAMIILAALFILFESGKKLVEGPTIQQVDVGTWICLLVLVINGILGLSLIRVGKKKSSLILEANGRHVLTDSVTSGGVLIGLLLVLFFPRNWLVIGTWTFDPVYFDPIFAILAALNILKEGIGLVHRAFNGLMDKVTDEEERAVLAVLETTSTARGISFHQVRMRNSGNRLWLQFHLIFPDGIALRQAHKQATEIEADLETAFPGAVITSHLETAGDHTEVHPEGVHPDGV